MTTIDPTSPKWKWRVTLRYNNTAKSPRRPCQVAVQSLHATDSSKDMEVRAAGQRTDVDVEVWKLRD